ncbi:MAG TPA: DUF192 domain-containing protein [Polyangia bacterium]|nr:DUF192 domain-containing protein [Polyangia bacterium]
MPATRELHPGVGGAQPSAAATGPAPIPTATIDTGKQPVSFYLQLAATPEERANGLVGRPTLAVDAGLLVIFDEPGMHGISMKKTLVPLDIIFIGADRRIVGIVENARPLSGTERRVSAASRFVLEIPAGLSSRHGFGVGQSVSFRGVPII